MKLARNEVIVIVVMLLLAIISGIKYKFAGKQTEVAQQAQTPVENPAQESAPATATSAPAAKPAPKLTYTQALEQYKDKRMQFDADCVATPNSVTYKNPVTLMLDNRASVARKITVNGRSYSLAAYGFTIVTISAQPLPKELSVQCGNKYNVAKILMQK